MTWIFSVLGAALIAVALRDIYATLWHPHGLGTLSRWVFRIIWSIAGRIRRHGRALGSAGPIGMVATVLLWAAMIVGGWALIYLPHMPGGFFFASALQPQSSSDPVASLYLSLVTVATLGYGDITPAYPALRLLIPVQALIGFVLFTAAISWILQIYPALIRRRAAARAVSLLASTDSAEVARHGEASIACALLDGVTEALTTVEFDLRQYSETYFFRDAEPDRSLAVMLAHVPEMVEAGEASAAMEVRRAAVCLERQLGSLTSYLDARYLHTGGSVEQVCAAYATDHRHRTTPR
ncbi:MULTISPECIES: potassium channel family protein [Rhodococcus]|uniref:potassium channel family protein n=1 Tax=Rhodococcus TaxID=1827 RepID=UPI0007E9410A|nr:MULTISPECIES: potassium channel family protein [Rhodococcus]OBA30753.1 transporter [Rhodococcus sp. 852002-51564_SCH6189132-a]QQM55713.1 two pore domain potassium channel family protein [Rhodococcus pyridinivorans]